MDILDTDSVPSERTVLSAAQSETSVSELPSSLRRRFLACEMAGGTEGEASSPAATPESSLFSARSVAVLMR